MQVRDLLQHVLLILHCINFLELVGQRLDSRGFDGLFVHSACVIVADFLCFRRQLRINRRLRRLLGDRVQRVVIALNQFVERAPSRILRRDLGALDPCAVGIFEEIVTGFHRRIDILRIKWRRTWRGLRIAFRRSLRLSK